ncbi:uncharacterized protein LOC114306739 [Camellia sinensis]|uniref:uncharacterized protein LOC114306739 n=1 Tax=Camellia sinensis TaxID=4442 RepID=UPI001036AB3C|nr:uncharacterized protein LOC114306739 [Camellia sinensis]
MVPPLMLLCKYGDRAIVFKVVSNCTLKDLTDFLSCKLKKFDNSGYILLSYCLPGHSQCMIDDDSNFQNMLSLVIPMVNGITHVGQRFIGCAKDFWTALCKYAVEIGFEFVYVKNEKCRVTAMCSMRESKACLWRVHASLESANNFFYIRTLHDEHTCGATVHTSKNSRMSSNLVASLIVNEVHRNPQTRPIDVVRQFTDQYGLTITYNHAWLGVEKARTTTFGDLFMSYDEIRWYMAIVMSTNPGSYLRLDNNHQSGRFKRFFVAFNAFIQGFRHCHPLLFIDGTFLKGKYKGTLLTATANNGDQGFFPLAMAIVDTETTDSWKWFFIHLSNILLDERPITFISDQNAGLLEALPKANLRDRFSGPSFSNTFRSRIVFLFSSCACTPTVGCFNQCLKELQDEGKGIVCGFLSNLPYDKWSNAYFKGQKYSEMHSNVAVFQFMDPSSLSFADYKDD